MRMTIAGTDNAIRWLLKDHSVYGLETVLKAIVRACEEDPDLDEAYVVNMLQHEFKRAKRQKEEKNNV